jgi:hypothetical protein
MFKIVSSKTIAEYKQRIKEDSDRIVKLIDEKIDLKGQIDSYERMINELQPPEAADLTAFQGCKKGPWCDACIYKKTYPIRKGSFNYDYINTCMRGVACKNFIPAEED